MGIKRKLKKPTGEIHPIEFSNGEFKIPSTKFKFPDNKIDIELKIANYFLLIAHKYNLSPFPERVKLISNKENDLDFSLKSKNYECLLELTEITPPGEMKGGYNGLSMDLNSGEHSAKIIKLILKKANNYNGINTKIILLMFTTDYRSRPSPDTETLVMDFLNKVPLNFFKIFLINPSLEHDGFITQFYPNKNLRLDDIKISQLKKSSIALFKPNF